MYHILASQRQAQFGAGQALDHHAVQFQAMAGSVQFALAVLGTIQGFDQRLGRLGAFQGAQHIVETQHQRARAPGNAQVAQHAGDQRLFGAVGQIGGCNHLGLGGAGEQLFLHGLGEGGAAGLHPHTPTRQLGAHIGNHVAIGIGDEPDKTVLGQNFARDDVTTLAQAGVVDNHGVRHRIVLVDFDRCCHQASVVSSPSATSSSTTSGSASIQPMATRAFMMMALASSLVRLKPSRAPGMRTRSLSLLTS